MLAVCYPSDTSLNYIMSQIFNYITLPTLQYLLSFETAPSPVDVCLTFYLTLIGKPHVRQTVPGVICRQNGRDTLFLCYSALTLQVLGFISSVYVLSFLGRK